MLAILASLMAMSTPEGGFPDWENHSRCNDTDAQILTSVLDVVTSAKSGDWDRFDDLVAEEIEFDFTDGDEWNRSDRQSERAEYRLRTRGSWKRQLFNTLARYDFDSYAIRQNYNLCMSGPDAIVLEMLGGEGVQRRSYLLSFTFEDGILVDVRGASAFIKTGEIGDNS